jgi:3-methyladenine DNA glycosylase/8-oxoguanine DNA glycosylase
VSHTRLRWTQAWAGPYDWPAMQAWLAARALDDVEEVTGGSYKRTWRNGDVRGVIEVRPRVASACLDVDAVADGPVPGEALAAHVVRVFDLERDLAVVSAALGTDPWMAAMLARHPGVRVPGGWEPFELAVRAVLGQQVTVRAARALVSTVARLAGPDMTAGLARAGLTRVFPTAAEVLAADLSPLRVPALRRATVIALAQAASDSDDLWTPDESLEAIVTRLRGVKGVGEWTAQYIALRALRHPDAFPASDVGLLRGAADAAGVRPSPADLLARAEAWRPHRAYAAQVLWESCLMRQDT